MYDCTGRFILKIYQILDAVPALTSRQLGRVDGNRLRLLVDFETLTGTAAISSEEIRDDQRR